LKVTNYSYGFTAEKIALKYLLKLGFQPLAQRYKTKYGELDLVVKKDKELLFCEVKARKKSYNLLAIITSKQIQRNYQAAEFFLAENKEYQNYTCRFDLLVILDKMVAEHIVNITLPDLY
jgi:putative endonuclease